MTQCKHICKLRVSHSHSVTNPQKWLCDVCGTTESVWACLSCPHVACGRFVEEHALNHYRAKDHPLVMDTNERYVFCYNCDDYVLNDNTFGDLKLLRSIIEAVRTGKGRLRDVSKDMSSAKDGTLSHLKYEDKVFTAILFRRFSLLGKYFRSWKNVAGISAKQLARIEWQRLEAVKKRLKSQETKTKLSNSSKKYSRKPKLQRSYKRSSNVSNAVFGVMKSSKRICGPGIIGLRNLGNTCYMNSVLQVLGHLAHIRDAFIDLTYPINPDTISSLDVSDKGCSNSGPSRDFSKSIQRQTTVECYEQITTPKYHQDVISGSSPSKRSRFSVGLSGGSEETSPKCAEKSLNEMIELLSHELHALFRVMWSGNCSLVSPRGLLFSVWHHIPDFKGHCQQDAQEFLCQLLDKVTCELNALPVDIQMFGKVADVIKKCFWGELISEVFCYTCSNLSRTYEPFCDLSLEFPHEFQDEKINKGNDISCPLELMLSEFTRTEQLDGYVYNCKVCNSANVDRASSLTKANKRLILNKLPLVLRFHLKRFRWSGRHHREKLNVHVQFPCKLDVKPYCRLSDDEVPTMYTLSAVVIHHGRGFSSGHYTAYCWNDHEQCWLNCNDARLSILSIDEVLQCQAYILFYTQQTVLSPTPRTV